EGSVEVKSRAGFKIIALVGLLIGLVALVQGLATPRWRKSDRSRAAAIDRPSGLAGDKPKADAFSSTVSAALLAKLPHLASQGGFVTSAACQSCHGEQYSSWHDSFHRSMTQVATVDTVLAPFQDIRLESRGREVYLSREGSEFYVTMADPDWEAGAAANAVDLTKAKPPIVRRQVIMTTGSHHMQGYWVASKTSNMLRQVPFIYLLNDQRWVPREDIFLAPPDGHRHFAVWNDNCLVCHSTAGNPNFDLARLTVSTEVAELGIACEACHGPGEAHIAFRSEEKNKSLRESSDDPIVNPANCSPRQSAEICGQCHSYFEPPDMRLFAKHGYLYRAGGDLQASHQLISFEQAREQKNEAAMGAYWTDGTCRISGREYSSMLESPCFQAGELSCISCHSMHDSQPNDQLASQMLSNQACVQCHGSYADNVEEHTHHAADSSGSLCYNCHMPHTTFGLLKGIRSHRIQSPKVLSGQVSDQPNACNLCHLDKTLAWTADQLTAWYDQPPAELDKDEKAVAASILWLLRGNAPQRAVLTWHLVWPPALEASGDDWQLPFLAQMLNDDYAVVRYLAGHALSRFSNDSEFKYDYVGAESKRIAVTKKVLEQWNARSQTAPSPAPESLLLDAKTGVLLEDRVQELLRTRDNRDVYLPE
ncbi:MAG: cytochrome c3 family protein, partial [Aureliella sp.]